MKLDDDDDGSSAYAKARADRLLGEAKELLDQAAPTTEESLADWMASFDLRWAADMRAIKLWQEHHPGNDLVWPDHADMVVWLLEQVDDLKRTLKELTEMIGEHNPEVLDAWIFMENNRLRGQGT